MLPRQARVLRVCPYHPIRAVVGFFSVLQSEDAADGSFAVRECHLNVWSLPGLLGYRPMVFDVGLLIEAESEVRAVELAVPLRIVPRVRDLSDVMGDDATARLIFGRRYLHTGDQIRLRQLDRPRTVMDVHVLETEHDGAGTDGIPTTLSLELDARPQERGAHDVDVRRLQVDEDASHEKGPDPKKAPTVLRVALADPLSPGSLGYLRTRLIVDHAGTMWRWTRVLGRRHGAFIDLRVPDAREGAVTHQGLHRRAKRLDRLEVFVILWDRYQLRGSNPELAYTRTLEAPAWKTYLRRSATGLRRKNIMVHRWSARDVSRDNPFRGLEGSAAPRLVEARQAPLQAA